jgi:hypothetical protein
MVSKYHIRLPGSIQLADYCIDISDLVLEQQKEEARFYACYYNALLK